MNVDTLIIGLIGLLLGLIGLTFEWRKSANEDKGIGLNYTSAKFKFSIWTLIVVGTILIIVGLIGGE